LTATTWTKIVFVSGLMCALFWPNLRRLWDKTNPFWGEANWSHSICVPLIGLYYLFINREQLLKTPVEPFVWGALTRRERWLYPMVVGLIGFLVWAVAQEGSAFGQIAGSARVGGMALMLLSGLILLADWSMGCLLFGIIVYAYGIYPGKNDFLKDFGMVVTLFGVVLALTGWRVMKIAWFPIAFLVCAIPWPGLVYSWIAGPLQVLAAKVAVGVLQTAGIWAEVRGTKIIMEGGHALNVAEACAGLRSLMTFISVGAAIAFLSARPLWQKFIITLSAVPIAIFCNVMRVSGQGFLDRWNREYSEGFAHQFVGIVMLIPAFFLILLVGWILDRIFIEEIDDKQRLIRANAARAKAGAQAGVIEIPRKAPGNVSVSATLGASRAAVLPPRPGLIAARPGTGQVNSVTKPQPRKAP
jgi:exosortase